MLRMAERRLGDAQPAEDVEARRRFAFDPVRRRSSVLTADALLVVGAPDSVLPRCLDTSGARTALDGLAARGLWVLATARRPGGATARRPAACPGFGLDK